MDVLDNDYDDDDDLYFVREPYTVEQRINGFVKYTEKKFHQRYRMSKAAAQFVLAKIENKIRSPMNRFVTKYYSNVCVYMHFYILYSIDINSHFALQKSRSRACNEITHDSTILWWRPAPIGCRRLTGC